MQSQLGRVNLPRNKKDRKPKPRLKRHEYESPDGNDRKPCAHTQGRGDTFQQCGLHKAYPVHDLRNPPGIGPRP